MTPKDIANKDRLIFALDVADTDTARQLVEQLGDSITFYKLGLELCMSGGYFELLDYVTANIMMPLGGLLLAVFVGWRVAPAAIKEELRIKSPWFFNTWFWLLRWVVPVSIAAIFVSNL